MQRPKDAETVAAPDQLVYAAPSERPQSRRDMVSCTNPRHNPGPEIDDPLHSLHMTRGGPAPDGEAVKDIWECVGLDEELTGFRSEVMSDFVQTKK